MKSRYSSVTSIAFTAYHNQKDGSDITNRTLLRDCLLRIACVSINDGMLEATGRKLVDTTDTEELNIQAPKTQSISNHPIIDGMIIWEWCLESRDKLGWLGDMFEQKGTCCMRDWAMQSIEKVQAVENLLYDRDTNFYASAPWDWEWVPVIMEVLKDICALSEITPEIVQTIESRVNALYPTPED